MEYRAREYEMIATKLLEDSERRLVLVYHDVCIICLINTFSIMNFEKVCPSETVIVVIFNIYKLTVNNSHLISMLVIVVISQYSCNKETRIYKLWIDHTIVFIAYHWLHSTSCDNSFFFFLFNRAKEADQLKDELTQARMSEKLAKERLLEVARVSPYPVCIDTPYFMVI